MSRIVEDLEHRLPASYSTPAYLVGAIQGTLEALAALGSYVNHAATVGLIELERGADIGAAASAIPALRGTPVIGAALPLSDVVAELCRVLVDENALMSSSDGTRAATLRVFTRLQTRLVELVSELGLEARELRVAGEGGRVDNAFGFISDASVVLLSAERCFVLAAGWSD